jgi:hypothetical protein
MTRVLCCRFCGAQITLVSGVWLALPHANMSGYCPASTDDERHKPEL